MATRLRWATDGTKMYSYYRTNPLTRTEKTATQMESIDNDRTWSGALNSDGWEYTWMWQFPATVQLSKMILNITNYGGTNTVSVSSDSTDGVDGSWTSVNTDVLTTLTYQTLTLSPVVDCRWLKITRWETYHGIPIRHLSFYGEYIDRWFEFWEADESAEFTAEYPLSLPDAKNDADYSEYVQFKLKNVDASSHDFSIAITAIKYDTDATVTNRIMLSIDGGVTKASSVNISGLAAGAFSGAIDIWGDMTKAQNPADGHHYFGIEVIVTA